MEQVKQCCRCKEIKPIDKFSKNKRARDGISWDCKECQSARYKTQYQQHKDKWKIRRREYRFENREKIYEYSKKYRQQVKRKIVYGCTIEKYDQMFEQQKGVCAICGKPERRVFCDKITSLCVDHDHKTGKIRALLCQKCNAILGCADDDIDILLTAVDFLKEHNCGRTYRTTFFI